MDLLNQLLALILGLVKSLLGGIGGGLPL